MMKLKAFFQTGLICLLATTLSAPVFAESADAPLPGDFQAAPATNPNKAAPHRSHQPRSRKATKTRSVKHAKRGSKQHAKHTPSQKRRSSKAAGKPIAKPRKPGKKPMHHHIKKHTHKKHKTKHRKHRLPKRA